jgi:regulator of sigma E protease
MFIFILIAFVSLIGLIILHEFGHFILAKKFGVRVDEFGIGYPPRIFGKKIGETIYSINLLPFGAFVRLPGEIEKVEEDKSSSSPFAVARVIDDQRSFSRQPVSKRAIIAFGGVLSFWLIGAILFSIVFSLGAPVAIDDEADSNLVNPRVQIASISVDSPARAAGLKPGDTIRKFSISNSQFSINKVKELQELTEKYKGEEIILTIERGKEIFDVSLVPRVSPPAGEGPMGVALVRTALKSYPWYQAPWQGILATVNLTKAIVQGYGQAIKNLIEKKPTGVEMMGPVGIFHLFTQVSQLGVSYFLQFVGMVAIYIALFNVLPIPAVDGGKLLFLGIEAIRKKPISEKVEQNITATFFALLIMMMIWVTIKDITKLF